MPSLFYLPWKSLLLSSLDPAELVAQCYLLAKCSAACDRTFSLAILKILPFKVIQHLFPLLLYNAERGVPSHHRTSPHFA